MHAPIRRGLTALGLAGTLALIPVSISPEDGLRTSEVCASGDCEPAPRGMCLQPDGPPVMNAKPAIDKT